MRVKTFKVGKAKQKKKRKEKRNDKVIYSQVYKVSQTGI